MNDEAPKHPETNELSPTHEVVSEGCLLTFLTAQDSFTVHLNDGTKLCLRDGSVWAMLFRNDAPTVPIWMESVETPNWIPIMLEQKRIKELA